MKRSLFFRLRMVCWAALALATVYGWYGLTEPFVQAKAAVYGTTATATHLEHHVRVLSQDFAGRYFDDAARLDGAAQYIETELRQAGVPVQRQPYRAGTRSFRNLVVQLGPDTSDVLVVGAHYDVFGRGMPGADDNASGVAGLIELARLLAQAPLRQRVELVAYSTEEPPYFRTPFMGSAVHAKTLKDSGKPASLMLSLECIGYFSDAPGSQAHPALLFDLLYPTVGNFIALVGHYEDGPMARRVKAAMLGASSLPVRSVNAPGFVVGVDFSDHRKYQSEGFVGMMLTDTAFYRNKAYHTVGDTADRLDYVRMAQVVDGARAVVLAEAGGDAL